jgi:diaminopimelate decarboxylase
LQHDVLINVDNMEELALIHSVHRRLALPRPARITLRLTGFAAGTQSFAVSDSTFGIPVREISPLLSYLNTNRRELAFLGFSFHLYTDSLDYKAAAVQETLQLLLEARRMGLNPVILNIGGGFRISYVPNSSKWQSFLVALKESVLHRSDLVTWNRRGLGYRSEAGKISGSPKIVDHAVALPPADQLCALLRAPLAEFGDLPIANIMDELGVSLHIEPGRALLDQAGATLGRVAFSKRSERGEPLTALEMNRTNLNSGELTLLTDPVLISRSPSVERFQTFLMGNLCVANELITPRKVCLPGMPRTGDILAFINTAAYLMDFAESPTLYQKVAEKVAIRPADGRYRWYRDEEYVPAVLEETHHDC